MLGISLAKFFEILVEAPGGPRGIRRYRRERTTSLGEKRKRAANSARKRRIE
jgi:hypothetical protein